MAEPKKKKKKKPPYVKQRGVGALCKVLLKNLHPQVKIQEKFPVAYRSHKQEISGCKIVKRETRNVGKKGSQKSVSFSLMKRLVHH